MIYPEDTGNSKSVERMDRSYISSESELDEAESLCLSKGGNPSIYWWEDVKGTVETCTHTIRDTLAKTG